MGEEEFLFFRGERVLRVPNLKIDTGAGRWGDAQMGREIFVPTPSPDRLLANSYSRISLDFACNFLVNLFHDRKSLRTYIRVFS